MNKKSLLHSIKTEILYRKCAPNIRGNFFFFEIPFVLFKQNKLKFFLKISFSGPIIKLSEYMVETGDGKQCPAKCRETKKDDEEDKQKDKNLSPKRLPCECICEKKKKSIEDDREKTDKPKAESDTEGKKTLDKKIKQELTMEECDETEEPKKIRDFKPKSRSCPCKGSKAKKKKK